MSENKSVEVNPQLVSTAKSSITGRNRFLPNTPQEIAITLCALGLVAAFCSPWVRFKGVTYNGHHPVSARCVAEDSLAHPLSCVGHNRTNQEPNRLP